MPVLSPVVPQGSGHRDPYTKLIRLERPVQDPDADAPREFKLKRDPTAKGSATYMLKIPLLKDPTCEEFLLFMRSVREAWKGQALLDAKDRAEFFKQLLGDAERTTFSTALPADGNVTNDDLDRAILALKKSIFPQGAWCSQMHLMLKHSGMRKPAGWTVRQYAHRMQEINNYLPEFPPKLNDEPATKLDDYLILMSVYYGLPNSYIKNMTVQGFQLELETLSSLIEFCESRLEPFDQPDKPSNSSSQKKESKSKRKKRDSDGDRDSHDNNKRGRGQQYCILHGKGSHPTGDCETLKKMAEERKQAQKERRKPHSPNKNNGREDFNAIVQAAVTKAMEAETNQIIKKVLRAQKKKREADDEDFNEIEVLKTKLNRKLNIQKDNEYDTDSDDE